jgi:hypothetical protein
MNWKDIRRGATVYHCIFTHWGKGVVQDVVSVNLGEAMFEKGDRRAIVQFEEHDTAMRMQATALRKTPNRKKIRDMVTWYRERGVQAEDGGDRLILPMDNDIDEINETDIDI